MLLKRYEEVHAKLVEQMDMNIKLLAINDSLTKKLNTMKQKSKLSIAQSELLGRLNQICQNTAQTQNSLLFNLTTEGDSLSIF